MSLSVDNLLPLLLLLPITTGLIIGYFRLTGKSLSSRRDKNTVPPGKYRRQKVFMILRALALILIVLAMCSVSLIRHAKDVATIFVADMSSSTITEHERMATFIEEAISYRDEKDMVGIVAFGYDSQVESKVSSTTLFDGFTTVINPQFSDLQKALIQSGALFPKDVRKRIVMLTDGRENIGDIARQIGSTLDNDVAIDFYDMSVADFGEVQVEAIELPKQGEKNQIIEMTVEIQSNVSQSAILYVYAGNNLRQELTIDLDVGDNYIVLTDTIVEGGLVPYRVELIPEKDTFKQNNQQSTFIMVSDMPRILVIEDDDKQGQNIINMMSTYAHVEVKHAKELPQEISGLIEYDAFVLADVAYADLDETFIENLDEIIRHQGKGLLCIGGDNSYGLGGYKDTLLETMLPVDMDVKSKEEKPNLGLVLVIDKSGSMSGGQYGGVTKLELAKEAAIRSTEILEEKDQLGGVIAFDDRTKWVIETSLVEDRDGMQDMIATIVPGGGGRPYYLPYQRRWMI